MVPAPSGHRRGRHRGGGLPPNSPGSLPVVMRTAGVAIGPLISYESAFPGLRRELARLGVDLTVVQGSLGTFQGSWLHAQQAAMEAVRAVETGRPAVLGAMSATSAAFDA